ncbi:MAG: peptidoglycan recognition family protein [Candidatus Rifleibacteriota bacterium]
MKSCFSAKKLLLPVLLLVLPMFSNAESLCVELVRRNLWQATPAIDSMMKVQNRINGIVIHHTAGRSPVASDESMIMKNIQSYHMNERKWGDIAYHLLIAPSGRVYEGRDPRFVGDSGTKYDTDGLLMICFLGTYEKHLPTPEARHAMKKLVKNQMEKYQVDSTKIWCHRDLAQTDCPGTALYQWVKKQKWD